MLAIYGARARPPKPKLHFTLSNSCPAVDWQCSMRLGVGWSYVLSCTFGVVKVGAGLVWSRQEFGWGGFRLVLGWGC